MRPTTPFSRSSSRHSPDEREAEARLRMSGRARLRLAKGGGWIIVAPSEMKVPEVCDLENHKCDNGDDQECRQCNYFMPCIKHTIAPDSSARTVRNSCASLLFLAS
jgi:hypothetical protein